jgi:beta-ribofuranosylaminobenzene 5'-phosphate synthase
MSRRSVTVRAPSRLHFGMFSFGRVDERQFGGVGAMIDTPGLLLRVANASQWQVTGPLRERSEAIAARVLDQLGVVQHPACRVEIVDAPLEHVGLGTGTQLALAVTAALNAFLGNGPRKPIALAQLAGRAERSAVGTYGFANGGLLVEAGKRPGDRVSPLVARVELCSEWRFVLIVPSGEQGKHGVDERRAFDQLPPVPPEVTASLCGECLLHLLPAAQEQRFDDFAASLYAFGHQAGMCFAKFQAGAFATTRLAQLVEKIRSTGIQGVGQSSWGPTLFALLPSEAAARQSIETWRAWPETAGAKFLIAAPANQGAHFEQE